jgi:hypothetical protein
MRTRISLIVGLALTALAVGIFIFRSPPVLAGTNAVPIEGTLRAMTNAGEACQEHELLPAGITAIRVSMEALSGPRVSVRVLQGGVLLTSGEQASGWTRQNVTIPVHSLPRAVRPVDVCFALAPENETVDLDGGRSAHALIASGGANPGGVGLAGAVYLPLLARPSSAALRIEYLRPGARTWWSQAVQVARRMGLGRAPSGTWIVLAVLVAMVTLVAIVSWLLVRRAP